MLQFNLIKEIAENWIPTNCQLWTATHSLGFIEYAKQSNQSAIIDFDDLDFDMPQILTPQPKDNPYIYEIAVGNILQIIANENLLHSFGTKTKYLQVRFGQDNLVQDRN